MRIALRMHKAAPSVPDDYMRLRMRARVLGGLRPRGTTLADHAWTILELLARPAPYIVRSVAISAVLFGILMAATVASADSLPNDALYGVKLTSESVRLALAAAPQDRASVELSIAEHRLAEAERLAVTGRVDDVLVASAMYSEHVASAAAELATEDDSLAQQLETTFASQRDRVQALALTLSADTRSAQAAQVLATIAQPRWATATDSAQRVAATAADVAERLAVVAESDVADSDDAPAPTVATAARASAAPQPTARARATHTARPTTETERRASEIAKLVRKAADDAKAAAEKAKHRR